MTETRIIDGIKYEANYKKDEHGDLREVFTPIRKPEQKKTIKQWFAAVEDAGLRRLLMESYNPNYSPNKQALSFYSAVFNGFSWGDFPGNGSWEDVVNGKITTYKPEEKKWPQEKDVGFIIDWLGDIHKKTLTLFYKLDSHSLQIGNFYKTKEQAQAVIDLKKHIHEFRCPKKGESAWVYSVASEWTPITIREGNIPTKMKYLSGALMPCVEVSDRAKRKELIEKRYGNN